MMDEEKIFTGYCRMLDCSRMVTAELDEGVWLSREEIPVEVNTPSLTHTMIQLFRQGKDPQ